MKHGPLAKGMSEMLENPLFIEQYVCVKQNGLLKDGMVNNVKNG